MNRMFFVFRRAVMTLLLVCSASIAMQGREVVNLNFDWYFHLGDLDAVPTALPAADAAGSC